MEHDSETTTYVTLTLSRDVYVCFSFSFGDVSGTTTVDFQLELGNTATSYEPYQCTTITTTLPQTVYGGTLDVVSGVLTITHGYISQYNGEAINEPWISDRDEYVSGTTPSSGAEVVYELTTPTTIQLTPTQIDSLLGRNNVWAGSGDVTVEYIADTKMYIQKVIS